MEKLQQPPIINKEKSKIIIKKKTLKSDLAAFYHGACFNPVQSTLLKTIKNGYFITWPGFTEQLVKNISYLQ